MGKKLKRVNLPKYPEGGNLETAKSPKYNPAFSSSDLSKLTGDDFKNLGFDYSSGDFKNPSSIILKDKSGNEFDFASDDLQGKGGYWKPRKPVAPSNNTSIVPNINQPTPSITTQPVNKEAYVYRSRNPKDKNQYYHIPGQDAPVTQAQYLAAGGKEDDIRMTDFKTGQLVPFTNGLNNIPNVKAKGGFLDKVGEVGTNYLKGTADVGLSALGMDNIVKDSDYKGVGANAIRSGANVVGQVAKTAAPIVAGAVGGPAAAQAVSIGQGIAGGFNPEDTSIKEGDKSRQIGAGLAQVGGFASQFMGKGGGNSLDPNAVAFSGPDMTSQSFANGGELTRYENGGTHEENPNGGVQLGQKGLVEENETRFKDYIFSDRLKDGKYSFADLSKKIDKKYSRRNGDKLDSEAKERELSRLREKQELKRSKFLEDSFKKAFGGPMDNMVKYGEGGKIEINPEHRGMFTDWAKSKGMSVSEAASHVMANKEKYSSHVVQMANFAKNASGWKHGNGGNLPKYDGLNNTQFLPTADLTYNESYDLPSQERELTYEERLKAISENPEKYKNTSSGMNYDNLVPREDKGQPFDWQNALGQVGRYAGSAYDIYRGLKGGDKVDFERVNPDLVDYSTSRDITNRELQRGFRDTESAIRSGSGGNSGSYLSNVGQAAAGRDQRIADATAKSYENERNTNAGLRNQGKYFNAQTQQQESIARQQEKDVASNTLSTGLYNAGLAAQMGSREHNQNISQDMAKVLINSGDYSYIYKNGSPVGIKSKDGEQHYFDDTKSSKSSKTKKK